MRKISPLKLGILLLALSLLSACAVDSLDPVAPPVTGNRWTVLVYMAADNDLDIAAPLDLQEMQQVGSTANVTVLVQYDTRSTPTRRYKVERGSLALLDDLGETSMADPATLRDFIVAGVQRYPADHYALIIWDHGNGWQTGVDKQVASLIEDWGNGTVKTLPLSNRQVADGLLAAAAVTGVKLDILGVDACLMATLEAAYEFRDAAGILVASQDNVQGFGWDYHDLLSRLTSNPLMSARNLAITMVESYRQFVESPSWGYGDQTISAITLGDGIVSVAQQTDSVAQALMATLDNPASSDAAVQAITDAYAVTQTLQPPTYVDLLDFAQKLDSLTTTATLQAALKSITIAAYHGSKRPRANGLNVVFIDLPMAIRFSAYDFDYTNISPVTGQTTRTGFILDYTWDEMMNDYFALKYPDLIRK
jgi:hypothetical protein